MNQNQLERFEKAVLTPRPVLTEILKDHGSKKLYEYAQDYIEVYMNPPIQARQDECIETFQEEVEKRLGSDVAASAARQFKKYYYAGTTDHHGPICSPFFLSGNLLMGAPYKEANDPDLQNVIVLACGNVSLGNSSFPRGLFFHTYQQGTLKPSRLAIMPSNAHSSTVYGYRAYTKTDIKKVRDALSEKRGSGEVSEREQKILLNLIDEVYDRPELYAMTEYSDQITKTNFDLWKRFFAESKGESPNLIYMEQESLVNRLIIKYHLFQDTILNRIFFDSSMDSALHKYFEGIMGAFERDKNYGTYLFWRIQNGQRVHLWKKGNALVTDDETYTLELTPERLKEALEKKEIMPSMMTIFMVLCFYYGVKCLGGFNQVNYLTEMKNAYIKMCADLGEYRSIEVCARAQTKEFCEFTTVFLGGPNGAMVPATGLDLILYGYDHNWEDFLEESKSITLKESFYPLFPDVYRVTYLEKDREADLNSITEAEISEFTGLSKKFKPCARIFDSAPESTLGSTPDSALNSAPTQCEHQSIKKDVPETAQQQLEGQEVL